MKKLTLVIFATVLSFCIFAQSPMSEVPSIDTNETFIQRQQSPEFPGGTEALQEFLRTNLKFPEKPDTKGTIFVTFVIEAGGEVTNVKILRGLTPELDAEALRVVGLMPRWTPGMSLNFSNEWNPVRVQFNMPLQVPQPMRSRTVTGTIIDEDSVPIPGVSVFVPPRCRCGHGTMVSTNMEGQFSITIPDTTTVIETAFIGFERSQIILSSDSVYNIQKVSSTVDLDKVIVFGPQSRDPRPPCECRCECEICVRICREKKEALEQGQTHQISRE